MNAGQLLTVGAPIAAALVSAAAVIWASQVDKRSKHRTAEAADKAAGAQQAAAVAADTAAKAAIVTAEAEMRKAVASEREQASVDWARYCEAQDRDNAGLRKRLGSMEARLDNAEMRSAAEAEKAAHESQRAAAAEKLYTIAVVYLRRVIGWIDDNLPGERYPAPPPELNLDI